jgi:type II secretory pathway component PulJ
MTSLEFLTLLIVFTVIFAMFLFTVHRMYRVVRNFAEDMVKFVSDDTEALKRDWQQVGDDLRAALSCAESEYENVSMKEGERK